MQHPSLVLHKSLPVCDSFLALFLGGCLGDRCPVLLAVAADVVEAAAGSILKQLPSAILICTPSSKVCNCSSNLEIGHVESATLSSILVIGCSQVCNCRQIWQSDAHRCNAVIDSGTQDPPIKKYGQLGFLLGGGGRLMVLEISRSLPSGVTPTICHDGCLKGCPCPWGEVNTWCKTSWCVPY